MKTNVTLFVLFCFTLFSCNTSENKTVKQQKINAEAVTPLPENSLGIELNNGEKWKVVDGMISYLRSMEKDINDFSTTQQKDYKLLAVNLQMNLDLLTSNCTMEGKAHDELHKWLLPYIDLVDQLTKSKDDIEAAKHYQLLQNAFVTFNQFFQ